MLIPWVLKRVCIFFFNKFKTGYTETDTSNLFAIQFNREKSFNSPYSLL